MKIDYTKLIRLGAVVALIGFIMSGPGGLLIVILLKPQPAWVSASVFVTHYNAVQTLPYYFGFLLVGGMLMLVAGHYLNYKKENHETKFHLLLSVAWTTVFATLIIFNYICQTTYVPNLALHYKPSYDMAINTFSMSNPLSTEIAFDIFQELAGRATPSLPLHITVILRVVPAGRLKWWMDALYNRQGAIILFLFAQDGIPYPESFIPTGFHRFCIPSRVP